MEFIWRKKIIVFVLGPGKGSGRGDEEALKLWQQICFVWLPQNELMTSISWKLRHLGPQSWIFRFFAKRRKASKLIKNNENHKRCNDLEIWKLQRKRENPDWKCKFRIKVQNSKWEFTVADPRSDPASWSNCRELEFWMLVFVEWGKRENPQKTLEVGTRTNKKFNRNLAPTSVF